MGCRSHSRSLGYTWKPRSKEQSISVPHKSEFEIKYPDVAKTQNVGWEGGREGALAVEAKNVPGRTVHMREMLELDSPFECIWNMRSVCENRWGGRSGGEWGLAMRKSLCFKTCSHSESYMYPFPLPCCVFGRSRSGTQQCPVSQQNLAWRTMIKKNCLETESVYNISLPSRHPLHLGKIHLPNWDCHSILRTINLDFTLIHASANLFGPKEMINSQCGLILGFCRIHAPANGVVNVL